MKSQSLEDGSISLTRRNMRFAILSACWGAIPQVMVRDSSIIIIFAALIGAGETVSVLTTAMSDLSLCLLMLPFAALSERVGEKRQIIVAQLVGVLAFLLMAAAPWLGVGAGSALLVALAVFTVSNSAYAASWLPLVGGVVPPAERGLFFGRLRVSWQLVSALFIMGSGWFVGRYASLGRLQVIIALAALASLGRVVYIARIRVPTAAVRPMRFGTALLETLRNRPLTGFGVYLFFLYLAANATIPVVFVFARNRLHLADNLIILFSVVVMGGLILGFLLGGRMVHRCGAKWVLLAAHIGFALLNFSLLAIRTDSLPCVVALGMILASYGLLTAGASIAVTSELLALASPANKAVSIAFGYSLYTAGLGASRMLASLMLGSGMLAEAWTLGTLVLTRYHTIFIYSGCGVLAAMMLLVLVPGMVRDVKILPAA